MQINENVRADLRQKWHNLIQIVDRYENASIEELTLAYYLIDSISDKIKHGLRHRLDDALIVRAVDTRLAEQVPPAFTVQIGGTQRPPSPRSPFGGIQIPRLPGQTNIQTFQRSVVPNQTGTLIPNQTGSNFVGTYGANQLGTNQLGTLGANQLGTNQLGTLGTNQLGGTFGGFMRPSVPVPA
jgi:hypothetical protein